MTTTAQGNGTVLTANALASAVENYIVSSGATALTTDTAVNIIARLQTAVAAAAVAQSGSFAPGVNAPPGVPNLFNVSFYVNIGNTNAGTLTLTAGTGVSFVGLATILTASQRGYIVTITSPTTVVFTTTGSSSGFIA